MCVKGILYEKKLHRREVQEEIEMNMQTEQEYFTDMCLRLQIGGRQHERVNNSNIEQEIRYLPDYRRKYLLELDKRAMETYGQRCLYRQVG